MEVSRIVLVVSPNNLPGCKDPFVDVKVHLTNGKSLRPGINAQGEIYVQEKGELTVWTPLQWRKLLAQAQIINHTTAEPKVRLTEPVKAWVREKIQAVYAHNAIHEATQAAKLKEFEAQQQALRNGRQARVQQEQAQVLGYPAPPPLEPEETLPVSGPTRRRPPKRRPLKCDLETLQSLEGEDLIRWFEELKRRPS